MLLIQSFILRLLKMDHKCSIIYIRHSLHYIYMMFMCICYIILSCFVRHRPLCCVSVCTSPRTTSPTTQQLPPSDRSSPWSLRGWWLRTSVSKVGGRVKLLLSQEKNGEIWWMRFFMEYRVGYRLRIGFMEAKLKKKKKKKKDKNRKFPAISF